MFPSPAMQCAIQVENEESWKGEGTGKGKRRVGNGGKIVKAEPRKFLRKSDTLRVERNDQGNGSQIEVRADICSGSDFYTYRI